MITVITDVLYLEARNAATVQRYEEHYADSTRPLADLVRIEDPAFYVHPWPIYERMQAEAPVYYYEPFNTWILTRDEDVSTRPAIPRPSQPRTASCFTTGCVATMPSASSSPATAR